MDEPLQLAEEGKSFSRELANMQAVYWKKEICCRKKLVLYLDPEELFRRQPDCSALALAFSCAGHRLPIPKEVLSLVARTLTPYNKDEERLAQDLIRWHHDSMPLLCVPVPKVGQSG
jgi:hypothetical protein